MQKNKLESVMALHGENGKDLSKIIGRSRGTVSLKINGKDGAEFTLSEIKTIKEHYDLTPEQVNEIFFE